MDIGWLQKYMDEDDTSEDYQNEDNGVDDVGDG